MGIEIKTPRSFTINLESILESLAIATLESFTSPSSSRFTVLILYFNVILTTAFRIINITIIAASIDAPQ